MARRDLDDDAPWLAEASPRAETRVTRRSFFWTLLVLLTLAAVAAIGMVVLLSKKGGGSTQGYMEADQAPLITAEPGPYKIPPTDPKGMAVEGQDQTIYAAGEGIDAGSTIDQSATPEAPIARPGSEPSEPTLPPPGPPRDLVPKITPDAVPAPAASPKPLIAKPVTAPLPAVAPAKSTTPPAPVVPRPVAVAPKPAVTPAPPASAAVASAAPKPADTPAKRSGTAQLGAFSTPEKAEAAWAALSGKLGMAGFGKHVIRIESNGQTLYRLRATGGDATTLCAGLKASGQPCTVVE